MRPDKKNIADDIEAILRGCRKNNRAFQKILYDRYFEGLYTHSQRYRLDDQERVALINKTMLSVFQNITTYTGEGALRSWIHTIHKNNLLNHFRSVKRKNTHIVVDSNTVDWWGQENGRPQDEIEMDYIHLAIESLPDKTKEVLELYAIQGFKHKEIARLLNMSESSSKFHLSKARELMAEKLKRNHG